jgi:hypothetical protein
MKFRTKKNHYNLSSQIGIHRKLLNKIFDGMDNMDRYSPTRTALDLKHFIDEQNKTQTQSEQQQHPSVKKLVILCLFNNFG